MDSGQLTNGGQQSIRAWRPALRALTASKSNTSSDCLIVQLASSRFHSLIKIILSSKSAVSKDFRLSAEVAVNQIRPSAILAISSFRHQHIRPQANSVASKSSPSSNLAIKLQRAPPYQNTHISAGQNQIAVHLQPCKSLAHNPILKKANSRVTTHRAITSVAEPERRRIIPRCASMSVSTSRVVITAGAP